MIYVFDTSAIVVLKHYFPKRFPTLWKGLKYLVADGDVVSVREVQNELESYNEVDFIQEWIKDNTEIFAKPENAELKVVRSILAVPHFQQLIGNKQLLKGTPVADPFVIAAAKVKNATVVTQEKAKPNAAKIPNVCEHFDVPCIDLESFMADQNWSF
ncbi:MAG: DUF4411 family protein [Planctomycetes bacterium]|nr:DUF4411 family protein [Planctomycetota bacterium]